MDRDSWRLYLKLDPLVEDARREDNFQQSSLTRHSLIPNNARRAGLDGSMSASGSAGLTFDPRRGSKFLFENFQPRGQEG